jgi:hypothetical protein
MDLDGAIKRRRVQVFLEMLQRDFRLVSMHKASLALSESVPRRSAMVLA